jgi:hypothetical protein
MHRKVVVASLLVVLWLAFAPHVAAKGKPDAGAVTLPKDIVEAPAQTAGTVIGTLGFRTDNKPYVNSAAIFFRRAGSTEAGSVLAWRGDATLRGDTQALGTKKGEFHYTPFSMSLPEGKYELIGMVASYGLLSASNAIAAAETFKTFQYGMRGAVAGGIGAGIGEAICAAGTTGDVTSSEGFVVPFEVRRGRVLYLGSFLAHGTVSHGKACFIPMPVPSTIYLSHADKWERDQVAFREGTMAVDPLLVDRAELAVNERTGYFIVAEDHVVEPKWKMKDYSSGRMSHDGKIAEYKAAHPVASDAPQPAADGAAPVAIPDPTAPAPVDAATVGATAPAPVESAAGH